MMEIIYTLNHDCTVQECVYIQIGKVSMEVAWIKLASFVVCAATPCVWHSTLHYVDT